MPATPTARTSRTASSPAKPRTRMGRARAGILSGAAACIAKYGTRKTTMGDIATVGGVAKGTLYNHFRAKRDVYAALLADEVDDLLAQLAALSAPRGSAEAVVEGAAFAAEWLSEHPVLAALRDREPELAARLARPDDGELWQRVRRYALELVSLAVAAGALHPRTEPEVAVETLLRWAVSYVTWPASPGAAEAAARQLVQGLVGAPLAGAPRPPSATTAPSAAPAHPAPVAPAAARRVTYSRRPA